MKKVRIDELDADCLLIDSYADLKKRGDVVSLVRVAYMNPLSIEVKLDLLRKLFIAPDRVWEQLEREENQQELLRLISHLDWVWKGPDIKPVEFLRIKGKKYLLPDENLYELGTAEFVVATAHLIGFYTAPTDFEGTGHLAKFCSTIIRPKKDVMERMKTGSLGDQREAFNSMKSENRWTSFLKVDIVTQILIAQWFNNACNRLLERYGMKGGEDSAPINQGIFVQDWERQIVKVAESHVYGNYDAVMQRNILDVLAYIDLKNDEIRRQNRKNSQKQ